MEPIARDFYETEELLKVLAQRRKILEQRTALRMATMDEFKTVKTASIDRLKTTMSKQNMAATERNKKLLQEIGYISATSLNKSGVGTASRSQNKDRLTEAKKKYLNYAEGLLPTWKQSKLDHYEEEMKRLKLEKHIAEERRKRLAIEVEKEEKMKAAIEKERRALSLALALEQQTQMQMRAAELLRMKEAEAADEALIQHFATVSEELLDMVAAKSQQGAREVHAELAPYFRPPVLPKYQNVSDTNAVHTTLLSQHAMEVQRTSDAADKAMVNNNNVIALGGAGSHVVGGGTTNAIANPRLSATTPSANTTTQPSSSSLLPSQASSQKLQVTQQQQPPPPDQDQIYRSDSTEEQYIAEQYLLMAGVHRSAVPSSRSPTPNSGLAPAASLSSSTHPPTGGRPQTSTQQPTTTLLHPQPKSLLFNRTAISGIHGQSQETAEEQEQGQGQGFVVIQSTTTQQPTASITSSSTEVVANAPLPVGTSTAVPDTLPGPSISSSAVSQVVSSMSSSNDRTTEPTPAAATTGSAATVIEMDRRGERTDATTTGGGSGSSGTGYGLDGPLSNAFSHVDTSDTATEDDNSEDNSSHNINNNNNVSSSSRGHNVTTGGQGGLSLAHNGDALIPMSASFTRSPRNSSSNNSSYNNLNTSLKNQGVGQGPTSGTGGNAGLSSGESSKHISGTTQSESHIQGSTPSNHQSNLSKTVREYHLELIDTLSHVECVKCIQALGTLIINHPSLTSGSLPPHAFFGAATAMLDTLRIVDIANTPTTSSSTAGSSGRGFSREALLRNDQMVLTSQLKGDITVAGSMVVAIIEDFGGDLVPIECLYGVVSLERLRKEQKHTPGSQELWTAIILHLRTYLERFGTTNPSSTTISTTDGGFDSLMADEICRIVTDALIKTAEESDKSRIERKVSKLVRAALVPEATVSQSHSPGSSISSTHKGNTTPLGGGTGNMGGTSRYNSSSNLNPSITSHLLSSPGMVSASDGASSNASRHSSINNRMMTSSTPMTTSNTSFARTPHRAIELDDDELEDDEDLGAPPPLPDLAEHHRSNTFLSNVFDRTTDAAEFDF